MKRKTLFLVLFISLHSVSQTPKPSIQRDSIITLINLSNESDYDYEQRKSYAIRAYEFARTINHDSLKLKSSENLSFIYLEKDNLQPFADYSAENLILASDLEDSLSMAKAHNNLGWYYSKIYSPDSSYYHYFNALKLYESLGRIRNQSSALLNMVLIQDAEKDYVGGETNAIKAINLIKTLPETENNLDLQWSLYNMLGVISQRLGEFERAIDYHNIALGLSDKMKDNFINNLYSTSNLSLSYRGLKNYDKALDYHNQLLEKNNLIEVFPEAYASYLNNRAYTQFEAKIEDVNVIKSDFLTAFKIADTLDNKERLMYICNDISEFYLDLNKLDSAYYFAEKAYNIGMDANFFDDVLESLKLMSETKQGKEGKVFLDEHIKLNDSLINKERAIRNKFARIEFETDQIKAEKEKATKERQIFLVSSISLFVMLLLLYVIITQRSKNKELEFVQRQQEANEEIYNLMLAQQDKIDEGRTQEKKRISEELHDGVLGRLFGTRLSLDSLNLQNTEDAVKTRGQYIDELKSIEQEIRKISHDLNTDFVAGSSFSDILRTLVEAQTQAYQLNHEYNEDTEIDWDNFSNKTKIHVYRMLQETMQNVYKHANASLIKISFELKNDVILLTVDDNGEGFNTNKARKGIGLKNFDSRTSEIGGKVEIFSTQGKGTKVKIHVPRK